MVDRDWSRGGDLGTMANGMVRNKQALRTIILVGVLANGSCNRFQEAWVMNCDHTVIC